MGDLPKTVTINEEGPREGFQIEAAEIATADKVEFIEALAETGLRQINCVSFVNGAKVPGMRDADEVAAAIRKREGVRYTGLWLNARGLERAMQTPLDIVGALHISASEAFSVRNTGKNFDETVVEQRRWARTYIDKGIPVEWGSVMTAFGCYHQGEIDVADVLKTVRAIRAIVTDVGASLSRLYLADTVGWGTPSAVERLIGAVREEWPEVSLALHLHDTRGTGLANAYAALRLGVDQFDASCAGLGGCPFAGHVGAAGNICTEDLAYMCEEMGIDTGIDLDALSECARMAERIVRHPLPGKLMRSGTLTRHRSSQS